MAYTYHGHSPSFQSDDGVNVTRYDHDGTNLLQENDDFVTLEAAAG